MLISEVFYSLQGEGELTGVPSVFVRTSGCNLRCVWCDTPYASWNPEGIQQPVEQLLRAIEAHPVARHVVITGGEPMIAPGIRDLARELKQRAYHVTIETAATIAPDGIACDLVSMSPKLLNSAPDATQHPTWRKRHEATRWQPAVVRAWLSAGCNYQFKFVISHPGDVDEMEGMIRSLGVEIPPHKIQLMPEAKTLDTMRSRASWLSEVCKSRGYRYAHRLHIELYGNKRGT
ncbi:MAG: 7-carboxy-7-deazaguanine synthase QueE [Opitutaceae bacterium]|nr:7-carboxy-7-deazaguanine synthase QueE [Opitutaceae bacterium]